MSLPTMLETETCPTAAAGPVDNTTCLETPSGISPGRWLVDIDAEQFRRDFNRQPFLLDHRLADQPLFDLSRLIELYCTLPRENVEFTAGDVPEGEDNDVTPRSGLSVEETIRRIEGAMP